MKIRHLMAFFTVCWLGIMVHCVWPPGYHRSGEIAIVTIVAVTAVLLCMMLRTVERENAQRRLQHARRHRTDSPQIRARHLHSVPPPGSTHD